MYKDLINDLVNSKIKISELSSQLLSQESYILSLEEQIQSLKHQSNKLAKKSNSACTQTSYEKLLFESQSQTNPVPVKVSQSVQTDLIIDKKFLMNDSLSSAKRLLMAYEEINKENSVKEEIPADTESKSEDYEKILLTKEPSLNFISAINLKSDLPVKETCPKSIQTPSKRRFSQESHV